MIQRAQQMGAAAYEDLLGDWQRPEGTTHVGVAKAAIDELNVDVLKSHQICYIMEFVACFWHTLFKSRG